MDFCICTCVCVVFLICDYCSFSSTLNCFEKSCFTLCNTVSSRRSRKFNFVPSRKRIEVIEWEFSSVQYRNMWFFVVLPFRLGCISSCRWGWWISTNGFVCILVDGFDLERKIFETKFVWTCCHWFFLSYSARFDAFFDETRKLFGVAIWIRFFQFFHVFRHM